MGQFQFFSTKYKISRKKGKKIDVILSKKNVLTKNWAEIVSRKKDNPRSRKYTHFFGHKTKWKLSKKLIKEAPQHSKMRKSNWGKKLAFSTLLYFTGKTMPYHSVLRRSACIDRVGQNFETYEKRSRPHLSTYLVMWQVTNIWWNSEENGPKFDSSYWWADRAGNLLARRFCNSTCTSFFSFLAFIGEWATSIKITVPPS